ncbi:uncharacterized protein TNCV_2040681 [Trichonephila clavipes]|nr:uncharacterized protein TNCV_2040681 [Trichonephila clavipes]
MISYSGIGTEVILRYVLLGKALTYTILKETPKATRGLLATDHVILNHGQVTWTTPELAPPLLTTTPYQREDVSALDRFNVHRCVPFRSRGQLSENESDGGELFCSSFDSDERRLRENTVNESEESADEIDNIPVNPGVYVSRVNTEWLHHNSSVPGRFAIRNAL